jgi:predicted dehydrogenase
MIKIAVIGLGHPHIFSMISQLLAEPEFNIVALCDPREPINVKRAMEMVPNAKCFENEEEVYAQCDFDAVLSSAANGYKGDIAIRALQNDKSIVFDKPLVTRKSDLEKIKSLLIEKPYLSANLWLTCRYAKGYYTVKEMINQGLIGDIVHMYFVRPMRLAPQNRPSWMFDERYGGILNDIGVHDLDLARWFSGSECKEISYAKASTARYKDYTIEDTGYVSMIMENNALVTILDSWLTPDKFPAHSDARVMITGTKGMIETVQYPEILVKVVSDDLEPRTVELLQPKNSQAKELLTILTNQDIPTILKPTDAIQSTELALEVQAMAEKR